MRKHLLKYMVGINQTEYANVFVIELIVYYILFLNTFCYNIIRKSSYDLSVKQRKKE